MKTNIVLEVIFCLLGLGLIAAIIRYPRQILINLPLEFLKFPFRVMWRRLGWIIEILAMIMGKHSYRSLLKTKRKLDFRVRDEDANPSEFTQS